MLQGNDLVLIGAACVLNLIGSGSRRLFARFVLRNPLLERSDLRLINTQFLVAKINEFLFLLELAAQCEDLSFETMLDLGHRMVVCFERMLALCKHGLDAVELSFKARARLCQLSRRARLCFLAAGLKFRDPLVQFGDFALGLL